MGLRILKLNNTLVFDQSPVQVPDHRAFARLLNLDLARTLITDNDLIALLPIFKSVQVLNLNSCTHISASALERCVRELGALHNISFPNREHDLKSVLPFASALPLTQLDLTNFLFVTDDAILTLAAATRLEMLSLAGTKLTDAGSAVLAHMSCLKELLLDRTSIGDNSMEYLRGLVWIEVLSLYRCERLTTAGIAMLGRCTFFSSKLKRLNLGFNKHIHDEALAAFTQCNELNTLNLENTDVSEEKALLLQAMSANTHHKSSAGEQASRPAKGEGGEFHILPVDEDKKYPPQPKGRHSEGLAGGPDLQSEFYVGPTTMPGPFISSMGANTAFEREHAQKSKKE
ncbi:hypothetical protein BGZ65_012609 [Modicella reniformis]|uniref:F-box/LRR-repeat protein 15-like leucin rich repeat domain-containing protein n=1 Tax=Modicella reniformis TaxID=1440133 RepID=A0A9P6M190_9FUNG|nr:hypothetical protein BGZ65_012609 [Modicella reniformis]